MANMQKSAHTLETKEMTVSVQEVTPVEPKPAKLSHEWKSGYFARFPFVSAICLCLVLGLTAGITTILATSNGKNVDTFCAGKFRGHSFKIQVSVWLSVFNFLAGKLLAVAFAEAVTIAWWVRAMKGRTLKQLHKDWQNGKSVVSVFFSPASFGFIAIGTIAFTMFSGLGAIMQKSSSTELSSSTYNTSLSMAYATTIPLGFSGYTLRSTTRELPATFPNAFRDAAQNWTGNTPIRMSVQDCPQKDGASCMFNLPGVGFKYTCSTKKRSYSDASLFTRPDGSMTTIPVAVFNTSFDPSSSGFWQIQLTATWMECTGANDTVSGSLIDWTCSLDPALVNYPVSVSKDIATLRPQTGSINFTPESQDPSIRPNVDEVLDTLPYKGDPLSSGYNEGITSTLAGIIRVLNSQFKSNVETGMDTRSYSEGTFALFFVTPDSLGGSCSAGSVKEPLTQMIDSVRDLMFRSSLAIATQNTTSVTATSQPGQAPPSGAAKTTTIDDAQVTLPITVYKTNKIFVAIGNSLMVLCVTCILPLFWGYWRLGRKVSLSPLELAQALHGPASETERHVTSVLDNAKDEQGNVHGSNATSDELVDLIGEVKVRYGQVGPGKLGMAADFEVTEPRHGAHYR